MRLGVVQRLRVEVPEVDMVDPSSGAQAVYGARAHCPDVPVAQNAEMESLDRWGRLRIQHFHERDTVQPEPERFQVSS